MPMSVYMPLWTLYTKYTPFHQKDVLFTQPSLQLLETECHALDFKATKLALHSNKEQIH